MSLGVTELILLFGILLLFFGPSKLPGLGKSIGETIRNFKKGLDTPEIDVTEESQKAEKLKSRPEKEKDPSEKA